MKSLNVLHRIAFALVAAFALVFSVPSLAKSPAKVAEKMDMMDTDNDGKVSQEEHAMGATEKFKKMDSNGDGSLTVEELSMMMKAHGKDMGDVKEKMKKMDTNKDKMISKQEFETGSSMMFVEMDTNKDNVLTAEEMQAGHKMKR